MPSMFTFYFLSFEIGLTYSFIQQVAIFKYIQKHHTMHSFPTYMLKTFIHVQTDAKDVDKYVSFIMLQVLHLN